MYTFINVYHTYSQKHLLSICWLISMFGPVPFVSVTLSAKRQYLYALEKALYNSINLCVSMVMPHCFGSRDKEENHRNIEKLNSDWFNCEQYRDIYTYTRLDNISQTLYILLQNNKCIYTTFKPFTCLWTK